MKHALTVSILLLAFFGNAYSQKKPLNPAVFDSWESISDVQLSNDGKYVAYTITPQEGDTTLVIKNTATLKEVKVGRGQNVQLAENSKLAVFRIVPSLAERKAAGKKSEQPKDSLGWLQFEKGDVVKIPDVKSFKIPEKSSRFFAFASQMPADTTEYNKSDKHYYLIVNYW